MNDPSHPLALKIEDINSYSGEKNTIEELLSLVAKSNAFALLLNEWNESME